MSDKEVENMIRDGMRDAIKSKLSATYSNPFDKLMQKCIEDNSESFRSLMAESISSCMLDNQFRNDIASSVRSNLAKILVQRFGGELEKQVNVLKSDPATRARITLAIEEIVKSGQK